MRRYILGIAGLILVSFALTFISWTPNNLSTSAQTENTKHNINLSEDTLYNSYLQKIYDSAHLAQSGLNINVFEKAVTGFYNLKNSGKVSSEKSVLTIADMDMNSTQKRLWIVDLDKKELLLNTWVAHGQRSGADKAVKFSNTNDSFQSSIGFYVTGETYNGQHGRSLRLDGMDDGFNDNARKRSIVVHGANYVSQGTINALGRLGRSQGCPAVAPELANKVINTIGGKTVLFINSSAQDYTSKYLDEHLAATLAQSTGAENTDQQIAETIDSLDL
ncbi:MAG TPA: murein L,D-transpeptidase catalytic domain family protein [Pedobacter sp.]|uniref:murein L,D-transpeptidase catalytic domain family protein n=1 Tax=Pedobacter sp. TaxID=1411316 RepID=UPI002B6C0AE4|nr:murein L,D-transpeptidase catalytic domain family protein [Pedobacter sp.]HMI04216.1 murein L,D-transpeptidase catalytic domain family protein [Pedobacter sp.]